MPRRKCYQDTGVALYRTYSEVYDRLRLSSTILKGENSYNSTVTDLEGCRRQLMILTGGSSTRPGYYYVSENSQWKIGILPALNLDEKIVLNDWQTRRTQLVNSGRRPLPDTLESMPVDLRDKLLTIHARQDVIGEEVVWLQKRITELAAIKAKNENNMLSQGALGSWREDKNGVIREIDGQAVRLIGGTPVIIQETSPYRGLPVYLYRELIIPAWRKRLDDLESKKLAEAQEQARAEGKPVPREISFNRLAKVPLSALPPWPDGVEPVAITEEVVKEVEPITTKKTVTLL